jgi:hypothetical protein
VPEAAGAAVAMTIAVGVGNSGKAVGRIHR